MECGITGVVKEINNLSRFVNHSEVTTLMHCHHISTPGIKFCDEYYVVFQKCANINTQAQVNEHYMAIGITENLSL